MKKWIGVILIGLMFFSSLAFAAIQSVTTVVQPGADQQAADIPTQQIIDYRMTPQQFQMALGRGLTVATYKYGKDCVECIDQRGLLEQAVMSQEFNGQIILEEIETTEPTSLVVESFVGRRDVESIDQQSLVNAFCELVAQPPIGCAVIQHQNDAAAQQ